jgi:hypothetical protein
MTERELILQLLRTELSNREDELARVRMELGHYGAERQTGWFGRRDLTWGEAEANALLNMQAVRAAIRWTETRS